MFAEREVLDTPLRDPLPGEGVAQGDVLQTDVRTVLDVPVADHVVVVRVGDGGAGDACLGVRHADVAGVGVPVAACRIGLRGVDGLQARTSLDILQLVAPQGVHVGELHLHVVVHLVSVGTVDEDAEVEVPVTEGVGLSEGELRHRRSDVGLVVVVDLAVRLSVRSADVLELQVADPGRGVAVEALAVGRILRCLRRGLEVGQVLVDAVGDESVEAVERFAHAGQADHVVPLSVAHDGCVLRPGECHQAVLVPRDLELGVPLEASGQRMRVHSQFDTGVADRPVVAVRRREDGRHVAGGAHVRRELERHEHVLRLLAVPVEGHVDAVVEQSQVEAHVPLLLAFPLHVEVRDVVRPVRFPQQGGHGLHQRAPLVGADGRVAGLSPACPQLSVRHIRPEEALPEELLVGEPP